MHILHDPSVISLDLGLSHGKQSVNAVTKRGCGTHGHQGVHIGTAVPQTTEAVNEEFLVDDHDNGRQQQLHEAQRHMIIRQPLRQRPAPHTVTHGNIHQHQQKAQRSDQSPLQHRRFPVFQCIRSRIFRLLAGIFQGSSVARRFHRRNNSLRLRRTFHTHGIGQQTHCAGLDSRHIAHCLFHSGAAGGAAHTCNRILFHNRHLISSVSAMSPPARR